MRRAEKYGLVVNKLADSTGVHKTKRTLVNGDVLRGISFEFDGVSGHKSKLVWYQWPETITVPVFAEKAGYHKVRTGLQPRKTICYGSSYKYSGLEHPVENNTPTDIQAIMGYTDKMYEVTDESDRPIAMCLGNLYPTFHHSISKHSDDESQFSYIRDVICWVTGYARTLIIRPKGKGDVVLNVDIPQGIYIMKGEWFQSDFTHEIPKKKESLFKKLCAVAPEKLSTLEKADWLANNKEIIKDQLPSLYQNYIDWSSPRASYTIRYFEKR